MCAFATPSLVTIFIVEDIFLKTSFASEKRENGNFWQIY
jgi:hypothetical protein